jgi:type IV secretory pathway VirB10-like protein
MRDAACNSKLFLGTEAAAGSGGAAAALPEPSSAGVGGGAVQAETVPAATSDDDQIRKRAFIAASVDGRTATSETLQPVMSPYALLAGSVITAALVTGIRSDLPGQITA